MKKGKLFLICLAGGVAFGALFFALFGVEAGYSWTLAWICAAGGLAFALGFFVVWLIVQKFSKPVTFDNPRAQNALQACEADFAYEARFHARCLQGKGLMSAVCETYVYLRQETLRIAYSYFGRVVVLEAAYSDVHAHVYEDGFFRFRWDGVEFSGRLIDEDAVVFAGGLQERGALLEADEPFPEA